MYIISTLILLLAVFCVYEGALVPQRPQNLKEADSAVPGRKHLPKHLRESENEGGVTNPPSENANKAQFAPRNLYIKDKSKLAKHLREPEVSKSEKVLSEKPLPRKKREITPRQVKKNFSERKLTDIPFWKPWKPHEFGQLTAKDCPAGDPLILTPLIRSGNITQAQKLSQVHLPGTNVLSYSGYFTVNQSDSSNTFFWFFPAEVAVPEDAPVLVWLQGGPGATSMFGIFDENGPFSVMADMSLKPRDYRWTLLANIIYIDNPVGTGFSFTKTDDGYARNEDQVGKNLYEALLQFYELFPQYQDGSLYLTGESYAGKYVPALGYTIHVNNPKSQLKLPLKGVAIGNGFVDPENMLDFGDLLYNVGLADDNERDYLKQETLLIQKAIQEQRWKDAFIIEDALMDGDLWKYPTYFYNITGSRFYYNYLQSAEPTGFGNYYQFLNQCYVRKAIHVGNQIFDGGVKVEQYLLDDIFQTAKNYLIPLLENYRVLLYNGQLDLICGLPLTENYLSLLQWSGADAYKKSVKYVWKVDDQDVEPAGYVRRAGQFYQVAVRRAGHMVPYDQPRFAFDLIYRFLNDVSFRN